MFGVVGMEQKFPMEQGWLLCRETGGRAELTMEVPGGGRGLYRGYVLGERGLMDLGTLLPEGNVLRLRRTFSVERLRSQGCWPVTGGRVQMTYAFTGQSAAAPPRGWKELDHPETLFPQDPVLAQAARAGGRGMLCRRQDETFCLAYPLDPRRPFPLTPAFCLARVKPLRGQPHVIFRFRPEGVPIPPAEEE